MLEFHWGESRPYSNIDWIIMPTVTKGVFAATSGHGCFYDSITELRCVPTEHSGIAYIASFLIDDQEGSAFVERHTFDELLDQQRREELVRLNRLADALE